MSLFPLCFYLSALNASFHLSRAFHFSQWLPSYLLIFAANPAPPPPPPHPPPPATLAFNTVHKLFGIYSMWPDARFPLGAWFPGDSTGGLGCVTTGEEGGWRVG